MEVRLVQSLCKRGELRGTIWLKLYRAKVLFLLIILFLGCGIRDAYCGLSKSEIRNPKSEISKDEAIKLFTNANENYLQAAKCIAARNNQEAKKVKRGGISIRNY